MRQDKCAKTAAASQSWIRGWCIDVADSWCASSRWWRDSLEVSWRSFLVNAHEIHTPTIMEICPIVTVSQEPELMQSTVKAGACRLVESVKLSYDDTVNQPSDGSTVLYCTKEFPKYCSVRHTKDPTSGKCSSALSRSDYGTCNCWPSVRARRHFSSGLLQTVACSTLTYYSERTWQYSIQLCMIHTMSLIQHWTWMNHAGCVVQLVMSSCFTW